MTETATVVPQTTTQTETPTVEVPTPTKTRKRTPQTFTLFEVLTPEGEVQEALDTVEEALGNGRNVFVALPTPEGAKENNKNSILSRAKTLARKEDASSAPYSGKNVVVASYPATTTLPVPGETRTRKKPKTKAELEAEIAELQKQLDEKTD